MVDGEKITFLNSATVNPVLASAQGRCPVCNRHEILMLGTRLWTEVRHYNNPCRNYGAEAFTYLKTGPCLPQRVLTVLVEENRNSPKVPKLCNEKQSPVWMWALE